MRDRATALAVALALALSGAACSGGAEKNVVNQYFTALRANDTNTLTSFAMVQFDQPVESWDVVAVGAEARTAAPLPELVKKQQELQAELDKNQREARAWYNDLNIYPKVDEVRAIREKGGKVPAALAPIQEKWDAFQAKDRELKKAVANAKAAVEREKRNVALSVGQIDDVENLAGEMITKDVEVEITSKGETKPYRMTLRRYELEGGSGQSVAALGRARWVVQSLEPKA